MNLTQEQIQEAIAAMSNGEMSPEDFGEQNPAIDLIIEATSTDTVKNVTKVQGAELRCIVTDENGIKPTTIENGATHQKYNRETDQIAWVTIINNRRYILRQDKEDIVDADVSEFRDMFGDKTGYALSYLSSFNSNNNILLDDEKVAKYNGATEYANSLIGNLNDDLKTMIITMCTNTDNYEAVCQTWDEATVFELDSTNPSTIEWGCRARTEQEYVAFESTYAILWMRPIVGNDLDIQAPDSLTQIVTRQVNPDKVPGLAPDSKATFVIEETLNEQVLAYALVTDDGLTGNMLGIRLFKNKEFDSIRSSF